MIDGSPPIATSSRSLSHLRKSQRDLILDLLSGRVDEDQFLRRFLLDPNDKATITQKVLDAAVELRSVSDVAFGMYLGSRFGLSEAEAELLTTLLEADWHQSHEDVAAALERLKSPAAIDALYRTALKKYDYLAYDDASALGVKCIWALGKTGGPRAVERLRDSSRLGNRILRANARKQLIRLGACEKR